jgi:sulfur carrier protein
VRIILNGTPRDVAERTTVAELLGTLKLQPKQVAVEINRELVPRGRHAIRVLCANDTVEIVTLVGGGQGE